MTMDHTPDLGVAAGPSPTPRKLLVIAAVLFAIGAPSLQAVMGFGLSASEFAGQGDSTLRAAGYAFSIWSVIYLGFLAYAVVQALPRNDDSRLIQDVGLPSVIAIAGCGAWILASAFNARWLSVLIIVVSAVTLTTALIRTSRRDGRFGARERMFVLWPLGLLAGWLTIASALNILTVLTAEGLIGPSPQIAAMAGIAIVALVGLLVLRATHLMAYGVPIAWGLVAVWVAEKAAKPEVALAALAAAVLVGAATAWQARVSAGRR